MSNTAPSRASPVVVFPLCRWCPPQETSQPHPPQFKFQIYQSLAIAAHQITISKQYISLNAQFGGYSTYFTRMYYMLFYHLVPDGTKPLLAPKLIVNWNLRNKPYWNFNQNIIFFYLRKCVFKVSAKWQPCWVLMPWLLETAKSTTAIVLTMYDEQTSHHVKGWYN